MTDELTSPDAIRTLIVDDEPPARDRLRRLLDAIDEVAVVGEAGSGNIVISNGGDTRLISVTDTSQVTFSGSTVTIAKASGGAA